MRRLLRILGGLLPWRWFRRARRRRQLRFTREGKYFVAITIGIGLAAINTGNNLLYLILGWLLSMIMASGVLSDLSLKRLRVRRRPPGQVFARRPFLMEISVTNDKKRLASYSVEIEDLIGDKPLDKKCYFLKIPAGRSQKTSYRHTFNRRGLYRFDGFRIATRFPFALFNKRRTVSADGEILVYPAVFDLPPPAPKARHIGDTLVRKVGRAGEFHGLREYREGDDRRSIHWRSSARGGRLLVREYEEEAERRTTLILDNALPEDADDDAEDKLESAVSMTASLAMSYLKRGYAVRLVTRTQTVPHAVGEAQLARILRTLALLETTTTAEKFRTGVEPRGENLLVVPRLSGFNPGDRPASVSYIYEAGAAA
ncbi:MAG: DUF58 domain-containing protein [Deltaproteobacteria bacterium]|nr:DUF58 domain-containing protein [Deltaproteobacteria bacterium]